MKLVGVAATYREGSLARECLRSLLRANCDHVVCFEGPFGDAPTAGEPSQFSDPEIRQAIKQQRLFIREGVWLDQPAKLNEIVRFCRRYEDGGPLWALHVDGDEVLLWPELFRDLLERFHEAGPDERRMRIKLVELDGTVAYTETHIIRLDLVERYVVSGTQVLFKGDTLVTALHNPDGDRFPIQGEPHLLHRSIMRRAGRDAPQMRAHLTGEADWFEQTAKAAGLDAVTQAARDPLCGVCKERPAELHGYCTRCYISTLTPAVRR